MCVWNFSLLILFRLERVLLVLVGVFLFDIDENEWLFSLADPSIEESDMVLDIFMKPCSFACCLKMSLSLDVSGS